MRFGLVAILLLLPLACTARPEAPPSGRAGVFFGGEEHGYLEPCGCNRPQLGGLARKGMAVAGGALLENGDLVTEPGRLSELKFETFLAAMSDIGCKAVNVGEGDLVLGIDFLRSAAGLARFPLISANLLDSDGERVFPAYADFEEGGERFRVVGVLDPGLAPGYPLADPATAVLEAVEGLPTTTRALLLYHGPESGARAVLEAVPRIEAASYAHSGGDPVVRSDRLFTPGDRSRWMVRLARRALVIELTEDFRNHPGMERALATYVRRLAEEDLLRRMNPLAAPGGGGYAGDASCVSCHAEAAEEHGGSRHDRAIESIKRTGRHVDPDCVVCHVIGYGEKTGFTSFEQTPALARVGCESCHGPSTDHVRTPTVKTTRVARASCLDCHTDDTDPGFRFEEKWPKIEHE